MEYFDKLKTYSGNVKNVFMRGMIDTVCTVQHTVRDVLPGNPLTRDYEITKQVGFAGPNLIWKIYSAVRKSSKQEASIFVLEKKLLDKYGKNLKEQIIERFRKGVQQATRIKHPKIIGIQHHLEESRDSLAFATEPVEASLADILGVRSKTPAVELFDIEIRYGILQICDALNFLHNDVKLIHRNLCPESILITLESGTWKLGCFEMSIQGTLDSSGKIATFFSEGFNPDAVELANPNLNYLAPESGSSTITPASDMYSLGILLYTLYNKGRLLYDCYQNYATFMSQAERMRHISQSALGVVPDAVKTQLLSLLSCDPAVRPEPASFAKNPFFDDIEVRTLEYFDSLFQVDNLQRSMFYKSLPQIISNFPMRVNLRRVLAVFAMEFVNVEMVPFILPNIFIIAEKATNEEYQKYVFPRLKQIFTQHVSFQTLLIIMKNMQLLLKKTHHDDVKSFILPILYNALDSNCLQVQEMCISIIPSFASLVDSRAMRAAVIPRLKRICLDTTTLSIRVNCLLCLGKLVKTFDKWMIIDDVLPLLQSVPSREPAVLMTILGIVKLALNNKDGLPKEALANKVVPLLLPLSIETSLNVDQFTAYINLIKDVIGQIEKEHRTKLQQIARLDSNRPLLPVAEEPENDKEVKPIIDQVMEEFDFQNTKPMSFEASSTIPDNVQKPIQANVEKSPNVNKTRKLSSDEFNELFERNLKMNSFHNEKPKTNSFHNEKPKMNSMNRSQSLMKKHKTPLILNDLKFDLSPVDQRNHTKYNTPKIDENILQGGLIKSTASKTVSNTNKTAFDDIQDLLG